jgi:hypothetical protein
MRFTPPIGTPKHMQIAAVQWNREAIAQAKASLDVNGMSSWSHLYLTCVDGFCCAHVGVVHGNAIIAHLEACMRGMEPNVIPPCSSSHTPFFSCHRYGECTIFDSWIHITGVEPYTYPNHTPFGAVCQLIDRILSPCPRYRRQMRYYWHGQLRHGGCRQGVAIREAVASARTKGV